MLRLDVSNELCTHTHTHTHSVYYMYFSLCDDGLWRDCTTSPDDENVCVLHFIGRLFLAAVSVFLCAKIFIFGESLDWITCELWAYGFENTADYDNVRGVGCF